MQSLVSLVVTCYNHEAYIEECLRSLFRQTYKNIELIVFNDGSTDASEDLIKSQLDASPFSRTEYHYHANQGIVKTRNLAFDKIKGEFLLFVDSDNYLPDNFVEELVKKANDEQADLVYTSLVNAETSETVVAVRSFDLKLFYFGNFMDNCTLIRTSCIGTTRYDSQLPKLVDYDFFMNLIVHRRAKAVACESTFIYYRVLGNSISSHGDINKYYAAYGYVLEKYFTAHPALAGWAMRKHFENLALLDINNSIRIEKFSVFEIKAGQLNPSPLMVRGMEEADQFSVKITAETEKIRIQPSNIPSFYSEIKVLSKKYGTEILPHHANGYVNGRVYIFKNFYPFIEFDVNFLGDDELLISYQRYNISDITGQGYIGHALAEQLTKQADKIRQIEQTDQAILQENFKAYQEDLHNHRAHIFKMQADYDELFRQYHATIGSRRWRYPTKIINFFRRKK